MRVMVSRKMWQGHLARRLHALVSDHPDFEVLWEPSPHVYFFRYLPNFLAERHGEPEVRELLNRLNQEIVDHVQRNRPSLVLTARVGDLVAIQMSICCETTSEQDIDDTFEAIARWGRLATKHHSVSYERPAEMEEIPCSSESCSSPTEFSVI